VKKKIEFAARRLCLLGDFKSCEKVVVETGNGNSNGNKAIGGRKQEAGSRVTEIRDCGMLDAGKSEIRVSRFEARGRAEQI